MSSSHERQNHEITIQNICLTDGYPGGKEKKERKKRERERLNREMLKKKENINGNILCGENMVT